MGRVRKKGQNITGWLVLDKPLGLTSTQALGKVRWLLDAKKAGHAGTLDPLASGVLPLAFGEATKTINFMMDARKTYEFTVQWGIATATLDAEGEVIARSDVRPSRTEIEAVLPRFIGDIEQMPPKFSAIKIDGKRAYDLARAGAEVVLKSRPVRIDALTLNNAPDADHAAFTVHCGKGTYVRSLARDLADALGTVGHVVHLRRTRVGPFCTEQALSIDELEALVKTGEALGALQPLSAALTDIAHFEVCEEQAADIRLGRTISLDAASIETLEEGAQVYAHCADQPVAIGHVEAGIFKVIRGFNSPASNA
jgi:tRNA pseudouridine55 synthase